MTLVWVYIISTWPKQGRTGQSVIVRNMYAKNIFVNFDMLSIHILRNYYEKKTKINIFFKRLKQLVTVGVNQFYFLFYLFLINSFSDIFNVHKLTISHKSYKWPCHENQNVLLTWNKQHWKENFIRIHHMPPKNLFDLCPVPPCFAMSPQTCVLFVLGTPVNDSMQLELKTKTKRKQGKFLYPKKI